MKTNFVYIILLIFSKFVYASECKVGCTVVNKNEVIYAGCANSKSNALLKAQKTCVIEISKFIKKLANGFPILPGVFNKGLVDICSISYDEDYGSSIACRNYEDEDHFFEDWTRVSCNDYKLGRDEKTGEKFGYTLPCSESKIESLLPQRE